MALQTRPIIIHAGDGSNETRTARLAVCICTTERWIVFQIEGQTHFHLQCPNCATSFCPHGVCEKDEEKPQVDQGVDTKPKVGEWKCDQCGMINPNADERCRSCFTEANER